MRNKLGNGCKVLGPVSVMQLAAIIIIITDYFIVMPWQEKNLLGELLFRISSKCGLDQQHHLGAG